MTVGQLETEMANRELFEWMMFYRLEWEAEREAQLDAQLMSKHQRRAHG